MDDRYIISTREEMDREIREHNKLSSYDRTNLAATLGIGIITILSVGLIIAILNEVMTTNMPRSGTTSTSPDKTDSAPGPTRPPTPSSTPR